MRALIVPFRSEEVSGLVGFARSLAGSVSGLAMDKRVEAVLASYVSRIYVVEGRVWLDGLASVVAGVSDLETIVVLPASKSGHVVASLASQLMDAAIITGVTGVKVDGEVVLERPVLSGKGLARLRFEPPLVVTVQHGRFRAEPREAAVERVPVKAEGGVVELLKRSEKPSAARGLEVAERIVAVGRGLRSKDDLGMIEELAAVLGAEIGCSRPVATDLKFLPEDRWIGLSGKKVSPKLYIALGISGQPQHIAGILDSKVIVAVNTDENAPITKYADYILVADLYKVVPELVRQLKKS